MILVVNAGSTSLKLNLVDEQERSEPVARIEDVRARDVRAVGSGRAEPVRAVESGLAEPVRAVAHRVVHGGPRFRDPTLIDDAVLEQIFELEALAPLHNEPALRGIRQAMAALPGVPQVAVFDTAFHRTIPPEAAVYPLPRRWREEWGVRRYGFHGLSVAWCAERVPQLLARAGSPPSGGPAAQAPDRPTQGLRLIVCHLGGGCSVTAVRDGRSLDTTMGFSPLEGVPMATRSGSVDPGALIYLMRERGLSPGELEQALNFDSGLRGLAGGSGDMAALERAAREGDADAQLAIDVFCHRLAGAVAAMAASAGGIDALTFTAGIGEHSARVRERACERLAFLGVQLDRDRNARAQPDCELSAPGSRVHVLAIQAREEIMAARAARAVLDTPT